MPAENPVIPSELVPNGNRVNRQLRLVTDRESIISPHRTPVDVRVLAAPAQGQRLVAMVMTGSPNRRSALCGKWARSQRETVRGSVATMISSNR